MTVRRRPQEAGLPLPSPALDLASEASWGGFLRLGDRGASPVGSALPDLSWCTCLGARIKAVSDSSNDMFSFILVSLWGRFWRAIIPDYSTFCDSRRDARNEVMLPKHFPSRLA